MTQLKESPELSFHQGTLIFKNFTHIPDLPCVQWDDRCRQWRAKAMYYSQIIQWLNNEKIAFQNLASKITPLLITSGTHLHLQPFQTEACQAWINAGCRGSVCLPTGSGKSWVALKAITLIRQSTLVIVPTLDLMSQWLDVLGNIIGVKVGLLGGGYHDIEDLTVTTYDSAFIHIDQYGSRFALLIFDEVHHLPSPSYALIPEMAIAPFRLGLTATYQRPDGLHGKLDRLIGSRVYEKSVKNMKGKHLADYETVKIAIELTPDEKKRYYENQTIYEQFIRQKKIKFSRPDLKTILRAGAFDPQARRAFIARMESRRIIVGASGKLDVLDSLLKIHRGDQILIFTISNDLVYQISEQFLIPAITHHTKVLERKWLLDGFRNGAYSVLVTSRVLNEGVDLPSANVAIILSGTASPVEHLQRLGRILRKGEHKKAMLYELVSRGTRETSMSYRRRRSDAYQ